MQIEPSLRASDADREQVAERLRHATAEGRLTADELEERLQSLFVARTYGELDVLLADLPAGRSPGGQRVRVGRWVVAIGAFTFMLTALGLLSIARLHSAAPVVGEGPGGGGQFRFHPPLADPTHAIIVAVFGVSAFAVLLICGVLLRVLMQSRRSIGRLNGPTSRVH
jgi:Domain of unknown function (DUF1707)